MFQEIKYFIEDYWKIILPVVIGLVLVIGVVFIVNKDDEPNKEGNNIVVNEGKESKEKEETEEGKTEETEGGESETEETNEETEDNISSVTGEEISDGKLKTDDSDNFVLDTALKSVNNESEVDVSLLEKYGSFDYTDRGGMDDLGNYFAMVDGINCGIEDMELESGFNECVTKLLPSLKYYEGDSEVEEYVENIGKALNTQNNILKAMKSDSENKEYETYFESLDYEVKSGARVMEVIEKLLSDDVEGIEREDLVYELSNKLSEWYEINDYNKQYMTVINSYNY